MYDVVGKVLAHGIRHPILADAAYFLLKPWEWLSVQVLGWLVPDARQMASKIYIKNQNK
jgi:hypothetical protein